MDTLNEVIKHLIAEQKGIKPEEVTDKMVQDYFVELKIEPGMDKADVEKLIGDEIEKHLGPLKETVGDLSKLMDEKLDGLEDLLKKTATPNVPSTGSGAGQDPNDPDLAIKSPLGINVGPHRGLSKRFPNLHKQFCDIAGIDPNRPQTLKKEDLLKGFANESAGFYDAEFDRFIDDVRQVSFLLNAINVQVFNNKSLQIPSITPGTRIFEPHAKGDTETDTYSLTPSQTTLTPSTAVAMITIHDNEVDDNVEGAAILDHVVRIIRDQMANEVEEMLLAGNDSQSESNILNMKDSFYIKATEGSAVQIDALSDADSTFPGANGFKAGKMMKNLPAKYRTAGRDLAFIMRDSIWIDIVDVLANKDSDRGFESFVGVTQQTLRQQRVIASPYVPNDLGGGSDRTYVLYTFLQNLIVGFNRQLKIEFQRNAAKIATEIVANFRVDNAIRATDGVVAYVNVKENPNT